MDTEIIIRILQINNNIFNEKLKSARREEFLFKPDESSWCILEVLCHLIDEEMEDFRIRVESILTNPDTPLPKIDPVGWVKSRKYLERDFDAMVVLFYNERQKSVEWLRSLKNPPWQNSHLHATLGPVTAEFFLVNWLAHDYLHLRQLTRLRYQFLQLDSGFSLRYAGTW